MEEQQALRIVKKCQCGGCQKYFSGNTIFDQHRIGSFHERRCMTSEEMKAAGMDYERCFVNVMIENKRLREEHDVWYDVAGRERMRASFSKLDAQEDDAE